MTTNLDVEYYVKAGFDSSYPKNSNDRLQIENEVENSYVNYLRNACYQERVNSKCMLICSVLLLAVYSC